MKKILWTHKGDSALKKKAEFMFEIPIEWTSKQLRRPESRLLRYYAQNDKYTAGCA